MVNIQLQPNTPDSIRWRWTTNGVYIARSAYQFQFLTCRLSNYPQLIWSSQTPPKCQFFAWLAIQGRCSTADILQKKGIACNPICQLCHLHQETALHMLGQCPFSRDVWRQIFTRNGICSRIPSPTEHSLESWWLEITQQQNEANARKTSCVIIASWWRLWKERNSRIFWATAASSFKVCDFITDDIREWNKAGLKGAQWMPPD